MQLVNIPVLVYPANPSPILRLLGLPCSTLPTLLELCNSANSYLSGNSPIGVPAAESDIVTMTGGVGN